MASEEHAGTEKADRVIAELEERLALLERERDEHLADLKRVAADFDNYRKRTAGGKERKGGRDNKRLT